MVSSGFVDTLRITMVLDNLTHHARMSSSQIQKPSKIKDPKANIMPALLTFFTLLLAADAAFVSPVARIPFKGTVSCQGMTATNNVWVIESDMARAARCAQDECDVYEMQHLVTSKFTN